MITTIEFDMEDIDDVQALRLVLNRNYVLSLLQDLRDNFFSHWKHAPLTDSQAALLEEVRSRLSERLDENRVDAILDD